MAGLFEYLQDIVFSLFTRNPEEAEKRRRLRYLSDELRKIRPPYFRRVGGQILPGFAVTILQLAQVLRPKNFNAVPDDFFNRTRPPLRSML